MDHDVTLPIIQLIHTDEEYYATCWELEEMLPRSTKCVFPEMGHQEAKASCQRFLKRHNMLVAPEELDSWFQQHFHIDQCHHLVLHVHDKKELYVFIHVE